MAKLKTTRGYFRNGLPYARFGNGSRNLVIINGLDLLHKPPSSLQLRMVINTYKCLAEDYMVYLVNRKSGMPSGYSVRDVSEDYATMIRDELGVAADIMGVSAGGAIAQYLAVDHSDLVHHLVLIATAYRMSDEAKDLMIRVRDLARQGKGRTVCTTMMGVIYTHGVKKYLFKVLMWLFPSFMFDPTTGPSDGVGEIEAALNHDFKDRLANIQVPTLVIGGNQDFFVPEALIRETADTIPNAKLILYQGLGHEAAFSKQLAADVLAFISNGNV